MSVRLGLIALIFYVLTLISVAWPHILFLSIAFDAGGLLCWTWGVIQWRKQ